MLIDGGVSDGAFSGRPSSGSGAPSDDADLPTGVLGTAAFADLRWPAGWSLGMRVGYGPPLPWHAVGPQVSALVSVGWTADVGLLPVGQREVGAAAEAARRDVLAQTVAAVEQLGVDAVVGPADVP